MRRLSGVLAAAALTVGASCPPRAEAAATQTPCSELNACSAIACELTRTLEGHAADSLVVTAALPASDRPLRDGGGLAALLSRLVAGRLGPSARITAPAPLGLARGAAQKVGRLLQLTPVVRDGVLEVTADLHDVRQGFWDRIRTPPREPVGHAFARRRIDAEVASFLEAPPLVALDQRRFRGPSAVLALACGDTNDDGSLELVVVTRSRVHLGRLRGDSFLGLGEVRWADVAPVAPVPLRQPLGAAWIDRQGITVGLSDRQSAVVLSPTLEMSETLVGQIPLDASTCLSVRGVALGGASPCRGDQRGGSPPPIEAADAVAQLEHVDARGERWQLVAWRDPASRALELLATGGPLRRVTLPGVGAQIALGDLDLDGQPEVLTSLPSAPGQADAVRVHTWTHGGALELRLQHPVPEGVDAIAVCPPERGRLSPVLVASGGRILVLG